MSAKSFFRRLLKEVVNPSEDLRVERQARKVIDLCRALLSEQGEFSGAALARDALAACQELPESGIAAFFDHLVHEFSPDAGDVVRAADAYRENPSWDRLLALQQIVEPARQELFRRLNMAPGGTAALVAMRRQVLRGLKAHPDWRVIDADLAHLFGSWFNRGFLRLERIDWNTSAIVLEKLIAYEAVHQIQGWEDLRRRLEADRRCFAFFHPALPREPLIFIEVALTRGMSAAVQPLLEVEAPVSDPGHHQLPGRAPWDFVRQPADQACGAGAAGGAAAHRPVRNAFAPAGIQGLARSRGGGTGRQSEGRHDDADIAAPANAGLASAPRNRAATRARRARTRRFLSSRSAG
jgi:hypothetical protein